MKYLGYDGRVCFTWQGLTEYETAKQIADRDGHEFSLTEEEYMHLLSLSCDFCGGDLPKTGMKLMRKVYKLGYHADNVVQRCKTCALKRGVLMSYEELKKALAP